MIVSSASRTYPWISGSTYSALQPILKSKPGNKPIDVLFLIWETPSPPKLVESFHFHPVAFIWKLWPMPTCIIMMTWDSLVSGDILSRKIFTLIKNSRIRYTLASMVRALHELWCYQHLELYDQQPKRSREEVINSSGSLKELDGSWNNKKGR